MDIPTISIAMPMDERARSAIAAFKSNFGQSPEVLAGAPGRVNLIGDHTDYQEGYVFPIAISQKCLVAMSKTLSGYRITSLNVNSSVDLGECLPEKPPERDQDVQWWHYVVGAIRLYCQKKSIPVPYGLDILIASDVPCGSGLSSSAALEVSVVTAMETLHGSFLHLMDKAILCQDTEHIWARVPCGLMDQAISCCGKDDYGMLLDCRTRLPKMVPVVCDGQIDFLVFDSALRHSLVDGEYKLRRDQCNAAVQALQEEDKNIKSLRDVRAPEGIRRSVVSDEMCYKRAVHVVSENERCLSFLKHLQDKDWTAAGRTMRESHTSLRDNFEVSTEEIEELCRIVDSQDGVYGSRMTGGGFGGCVVCLVDRKATEKVKAHTLHEYNKFLEKLKADTKSSVDHGIPNAFIALPSQGAHVYDLSELWIK